MSAQLRKNTDTTTLPDGSTIPLVGLGTWRSTGEGVAYNAVLSALKAGYRHIDTARIYGNEDEVGRAIKDSKVPRKEIFVTTKLWNTDQNKAAEALDASLKKLQLDYVDLYLIHWPTPQDENDKPLTNWTYIDTYKELQKLQKTGKAKSIGVSNFTKTKLQKLLADKDVTVKPAVNQIEAHPLLPQPELTAYLKEQGIVIEAYSPLGSADSPLFKNEEVIAIAKKNNVDAGQVLVSWAIQRGTVVLPKSVKEHRIESNFQTFTLPDEDFEALNNLSKKHGILRTADAFGAFPEGEI